MKHVQDVSRITYPKKNKNCSLANVKCFDFFSRDLSRNIRKKVYDVNLYPRKESLSFRIDLSNVEHRNIFKLRQIDKETQMFFSWIQI